MADALGSCLAVAEAVAESPVNAMPWLPGGVLPAELITGHKSIDFEHRQLLGTMMSVRNVCHGFTCFQDCSGCPGSRRSHCENDLVCLLGDLLAFILDHFRTEENIMRDSLLMMVDRDVCEAHMEDHAAISAKIQEIVAALDPLNTVGLLRQLDSLLGTWITHHIAMHDMILARWLARDDSSLLPLTQANA